MANVFRSMVVGMFLALVLAGCGDGHRNYKPNPIAGASSAGGGDPGSDDPSVSPQYVKNLTDDPLSGLGSSASPGGNAPPKNWSVDPCKVLKPNVKASGKNMFGQTIFIGTDKPDIIFGTNGPDFINGKKGEDIICGFDGEDTIFGGADNDYIDGGAGIDTIDAGGGNDTVHGRGGSDMIRGGPGNDFLSGDLLDDTIYGEEGDDLLIGGHGNDHMHGGPGDDWLRGDTGRDELVGGEGYDTASFTTTMPPGQTTTPGIDGVEVDLNPVKEYHLKVLDPNDKDAKVMVGLATGDGAWEPVLGIERVAGSAFNDNMAGPSWAPLVGTLGNDLCNGQPCDDPAELPADGHVRVLVDDNDVDPGLQILGTDSDDVISVDVTDDAIRVTSSNPIAVGTLCELVNGDEHVAECRLPGNLFYLVAWGGAGNDQIDLPDGFGLDATTHASGGDGDDTLNGGGGQDVLFSGPTGADFLIGNAGDDALLSESTGADKAKPGNEYGGGADYLEGGEGDDQLVSDYPCGGHTFWGGPGWDIAGFARVGDTMRIRAQLGGDLVKEHRSEFWGKALSPDRCGNYKPGWTTLKPGLEVLEGAELDDELFGDDKNNVIWGRGGNDTIRGYGGNDWLDGHDGQDEIWGDEGKDYIHGGDGFDHIHAKDGQKDGAISCGGDGGKLEDSDPNDKASNCN